MSLQTRLTALATAIGTDIKALVTAINLKTTIHSGLGAPGAGLGQVGDWYIEQITGGIWQKNPAWMQQVPYPLAIPVVNALPSSPTDGQMCRFQTAAMAAGQVSPMLLSYRAAQAGAYKWDVLGGGRMHAIQSAAASQSTANFNTYAAMGSGPTIVVPVSGIWDVEAWGPIYTDTAPLRDTRVAIGLDSVNQGQMAWDSRSGPYEGGVHFGALPYLAAGVNQTFHLMVSTSGIVMSFGNPVGWRMLARPQRVG